MPNAFPDGSPPEKPGSHESSSGSIRDAAGSKPPKGGKPAPEQPEPLPVAVEATRLQTWLAIRNRETTANIAPNRECTFGIGRDSGADVAFLAPDGVSSTTGIYLNLLTDEHGNVRLKRSAEDKKAAVETEDGIKPLTWSDKPDEGWVDFDPKVDKIAFGGLQFFELRQEQRQCVELTVTVGDEGRTLDISEEILIGREEENGQGQLLSETVSRRHAKICQTTEGLFIEDRGSMNGTFIARPSEREPIKVKSTPVLMKPGDRVWFGSVKGAESAYLDVVPVRQMSHGRPRADVPPPPSANRAVRGAGRDTLEEDDDRLSKGNAVLDTGRVDAQN